MILCKDFRYVEGTFGKFTVLLVNQDQIYQNWSAKVDWNKQLSAKVE
jgi:hypothetical protein